MAKKRKVEKKKRDFTPASLSLMLVVANTCTRSILAEVGIPINPSHRSTSVCLCFAQRKQNPHINVVHFMNKIYFVAYVWLCFRSPSPGSVSYEFAIKEQSGNVLVHFLSFYLASSMNRETAAQRRHRVEITASLLRKALGKLYFTTQM